MRKNFKSQIKPDERRKVKMEMEKIIDIEGLNSYWRKTKAFDKKNNFDGFKKFVNDKVIPFFLEYNSFTEKELENEIGKFLIREEKSKKKSNSNVDRIYNIASFFLVLKSFPTNYIGNNRNKSYLSKMFSIDAQQIAHIFQPSKNMKEAISTTQYRQFYEWISKQAEKAEGISENEFKKEVLPMVSFLISKVVYSKNRGLIKEPFVKFMTHSIRAIETKEDLKVFKLFMEAIMGFLPRKS
jgi:CRISPR type III-A-associated protein Csm2